MVGDVTVLVAIKAADVKKNKENNNYLCGCGGRRGQMNGVGGGHLRAQWWWCGCQHCGCKEKEKREKKKNLQVSVGG